MSGDIAVRLGILLLVIIRFARLSLILDPPKRKRLVPFLLLVLIPMITSLAIGIDFRLKEYAYFRANPNAIGRPIWLDNIRKDESLVAFVSAFLAMSVNIGTDAVFFNIIKTRLHLRKVQVGMSAYALAIAAKLVYLGMMSWAQVITSGPFNLPVKTMAITLSRFSPTVETYVFFTRTIPQSRTLLQSRKLAASSEAIEQTIDQTILVTNSLATSEAPSHVGPSELPPHPPLDFQGRISMTSAPVGKNSATASTKGIDSKPSTVNPSQNELWLAPDDE